MSGEISASNNNSAAVTPKKKTTAKPSTPSSSAAATPGSGKRGRKAQGEVNGGVVGGEDDSEGLPNGDAKTPSKKAKKTNGGGVKAEEYDIADPNFFGADEDMFQ